VCPILLLFFQKNKENKYKKTRKYFLIILMHMRVQNVQTREYNNHIKKNLVHATHNVVPFALTREFITSNTIATHLSCFCMIDGVKYLFLDKIRYREVC